MFCIQMLFFLRSEEYLHEISNHILHLRKSTSEFLGMPSHPSEKPLFQVF